MIRAIVLSSLLLAGCRSSTPDSCAAPVACGHGSVQTCVSSDGAHCSYRTSDDDTIDCAACGDCSAAAEKVASWCSGGGSGVGGNGAGGATGSGSVAQSDECKQLLACASVAAPGQFTQLVPVYGPSGSCWSDATVAASCTQACIRNLDDLATQSSAPECRAISLDMAVPPPRDFAPPPPADLAGTCHLQGEPCTVDTDCCNQVCFAATTCFL